ncbi:hypothetical protein N0V93_008038 [Gnomoniopsis smithogilvyi]|uniref:High-affinity methionine permease n=1 Tax=Gnomoniopsis smithogilvyi TaxID=1191159 RepID=A0A9W8YLX4_9PEZI|nr:hypothetical protein N0V93_008038 [Gnomoniopsis smithogilvyi]
MHVYLEYGLNLPRVLHRGREQSVARSGGDLHYLQYVYRWIGYRGQTVLLITPLFGISFIVLGNMAGNCVAFALYVLRAAGYQGDDLNIGNIRGLALGVAICSCFIHAISRRGGIVLNNTLAMFKIAVLVMIIITAIVVSKQKPEYNRWDENTGAGVFNKKGEVSGYASAFLSIIFAYSGFEQPNYVLGEIRRPRKTFPRATVFGVVTACLLYVAVNISYMVLVPFTACLSESDNTIAANSTILNTSVAEQFFVLAYNDGAADASGTGCYLGTSAHSSKGYRMFAAFVAVSCLGNIIVMTYTAARVKQEIAKTGMLPYSKFFADNRDFSVGRFLRWIRDDKQKFRKILRNGFLSPEQHSEETPIGAFLLHIGSCIILLLATAGMSGDNAYSLLTRLYAYVINAFNGVLLSSGILILRFFGPAATTDGAIVKWSDMTGTTFRPLLSVTCAVIYLLGNLWPIFASWVPQSSNPSSVGQNTAYNAAWWLMPTISLIVLAVSLLWFVGFLAYAKRREKTKNEVFTIDRVPEFESSDTPGHEPGADEDGLVLVHETVYLDWRALDMMDDQESVKHK